MSSDLEAALAFQVRAVGLPSPVREAVLIPGRKYRADFAWPTHRLVVEVDGGTYSGGRHTTGAGYARDCEKQNLLTLAGWRVLRVTGDQVNDGRALRWIEQALAPTIPPLPPPNPSLMGLK